MPSFSLHRPFLMGWALLFGAAATFAVEFDPPVAITGATVVTAPGKPLGERDGRDASGPDRSGGDERLHSEGRPGDRWRGLVFVYAGFMDAASHVGISDEAPTEDDARAGRSGRDRSEGISPRPACGWRTGMGSGRI
jgi:hypothetical protein